MELAFQTSIGMAFKTIIVHLLLMFLGHLYSNFSNIVKEHLLWKQYCWLLIKY